MFPALELIVSDVIATLSEEDKRIITGQDQLDKLEQVWFESSFARWIRNRYDLWHNSPLTEKWRNDQSSRVIRDGVDHSPDHPDAVSAQVVELVKQRLLATESN